MTTRNAVPNYDHVAQIHYGAISMNSVSSEALDIGGNNWTDESYEACKEEAMLESDFDEDDFNNDYMGDSDTSWSYHDGEYDIITVLVNDLMIIRSPYYTFCLECSPCVPNAGDLDSPREVGLKTYCLGPDFFDEESPCPYKVYSVRTGEETTS